MCLQNTGIMAHGTIFWMDLHAGMTKSYRTSLRFDYFDQQGQLKFSCFIEKYLMTN
jgi:hypothetical protein